MNFKKLIMSLVWSFVVAFGVGGISLIYFDSLYRKRVAAGGELSPMDIGFTWMAVIIVAGLITFVLGLFGKLPGTKS